MNIDKSLKLINDTESLSEGLSNIYDQVPSGDCKGCLRCCTESVNTFFVEYVHILRFLQSNPQVLEEHAKKISRFFLLEMVEEMYCPFVRTDGKCAIYFDRPLPCRVFGHLEEIDYQQNYEKVLESNESLATYYKKNHDLDLPRAIIERKIPYCKDFTSDKKMDIDERDDLVDLMFSLDSRFLMNECIGFDDVNQSLITWFLKSIVTIEEAGELRVNAMVYYQNKQTAELELLINDIANKLVKLNTI